MSRLVCSGIQVRKSVPASMTTFDPDGPDKSKPNLPLVKPNDALVILLGTLTGAEPRMASARATDALVPAVVDEPPAYNVLPDTATLASAPGQTSRRAGNSVPLASMARSRLYAISRPDSLN